MKKFKICQKIVKNCKKSSKLSIFDEKFCSKNTAWLSKGARGELEGTRGYGCSSLELYKLYYSMKNIKNKYLVWGLGSPHYYIFMALLKCQFQ